MKKKSRSFSINVRSSLFILSFIIAYGCSKSPETISIDKKGGSVLYPYQKEKQIPARDLLSTISSLSCFKLQDKDTLILSGNNQVVQVAENYVLFDRVLNFALLIDSKGKTIQRLGKFGAKPGEYLSVQSVEFDKKANRILLYTSEKKSVLFFDLKGNYMNEISLDFFGTEMKIIDDSTLAFFVNQNRSKISERYNILLTDRSGKVLKRGYGWGKLPGMSYTFAGGFSSSESDLYSSPFNDSIFSVSKDKIKLKYVVSFGEHTLPENLRPSSLKLSMNILNYSFMGRPLAETKNYLSIPYNTKNLLDGSIFSKTTGKSLNYSMAYQIFPLSQIVKTCGATYESDFFFTVLSMSNVLNHLKKNPEDWVRLQSFSPELYQMIKTSKLEDNPIVVKFKYNF